MGRPKHMAERFVIYRTKRGLRWKLLSPNNEVMARGGEPFKAGPGRKSTRDALYRIRRSIKLVRMYTALAHVEVKL